MVFGTNLWNLVQVYMNHMSQVNRWDFLQIHFEKSFPDKSAFVEEKEAVATARV